MQAHLVHSMAAFGIVIELGNAICDNVGTANGLRDSSEGADGIAHDPA